MQPFPPALMPSMPQPSGMSNDLSHLDLSDSMGLVAAAPTGGLTITFFYAQLRVDDPMNAEAHGNYKTVLCVRKRIHGDRLTEAVDVISERAAQAMYPREYAWFKQNEAVPTDGTPLHELPGISQSQIAILVIYGIRSIEDLVALTDDQVGQMHNMDARSAYALARKWWATKKDSTDLIEAAARDAARDAELDRLRASEAENARRLTELQAQIELLTRMGQAGAPAAALATTATVVGSRNGAQLVDNDDAVDLSSQSGAFAGGYIASGNDDLIDPPAPVSLPGLGRKK